MRSVRKKLDYTKTWQDEALVEWVDGFLLGDGHIAETSAAGIAAYATISSSNENWAQYAMKGFDAYQPLPPKKRPNGKGVDGGSLFAWQSSTLSHPDLKVHRDRWYPGGKKRIPLDVRLTGTSLRLWYIGDGSMDKGFVSIAAYDFSRVEVETVVEKMARDLGIVFTIHEKPGHGTGMTIYLPATYTSTFFDLIGKECPVEGYEYKFEASPDRWLRTIESTAEELEVDPFWIRNLISSGRAASIKREKLRFITAENFEKIKEIRDTEYRPRGVGARKRGLTMEEVKCLLRIHDRRLPDLLSKAGVVPRQTKGGHYRFTEEDVDKMRPFVSTRFHDLKIKMEV